MEWLLSTRQQVVAGGGRVVAEIGQYLATMVVVVAVLLGPSWVIIRRVVATLEPLTALALAPLATMAWGAMVMSLSLVFPWSPVATARGGLVLWIGTGVLVVARGWHDRRLHPSADVRRAVAVWLLLFVSVAAFLAVPSSPSFPSTAFTISAGRVETPRAPGLPADSHLPYRVGQLVLLRDGGEALRDGFHPGWWISDRGPMNGLVFAYAAGAAGVAIPAPDLISLSAEGSVVEFVDPYGYWLYLLVSAAVGTAGVLGVIALARTWLPGRHLLAGVVFCLMPGIFIYAIYPRPSLALVLPALAGIAAAVQRRPLVAGCAVASCFLIHPTGAVWVAATVVVAVMSCERSRPLLRTTASVLVAPAALALPWMVFTSQVVGGSSRMLVWPLGAKLTDPTDPAGGLSEAWTALVDRGLWSVLTVRIDATVQSIIPNSFRDLPGSLDSPFDWFYVHALSAWGITGLVLFPLGVWGIARVPTPARRRMVVVLAVVVGLNVLAEGFPESYFPQSLLPLCGLLAIGVVALVRFWDLPWRLVVVSLAAIELGSMVWGPWLFVPVNISTGGLAAMVLLAVLAQLMLLGLAVRWFRDERVGSGDLAGSVVGGH